MTGRPLRARCAAAPGPRAPRPGRLSGGGGGGGSPPAAPMSEGPPYGEGQLAGDAAVGQLPFPVRLRGGDGLLAGGQGKRPPKLGQIGRSKRGECRGERGAPGAARDAGHGPRDAAGCSGNHAECLASCVPETFPGDAGHRGPSPGTWHDDRAS